MSQFNSVSYRRAKRAMLDARSGRKRKLGALGGQVIPVNNPWVKIALRQGKPSTFTNTTRADHPTPAAQGPTKRGQQQMGTQPALPQVGLLNQNKDKGGLKDVAVLPKRSALPGADAQHNSAIGKRRKRAKHIEEANDGDPTTNAPLPPPNPPTRDPNASIIRRGKVKIPNGFPGSAPAPAPGPPLWRNRAPAGKARRAMKKANIQGVESYFGSGVPAVRFLTPPQRRSTKFFKPSRTHIPNLDNKKLQLEDRFQTPKGKQLRRASFNQIGIHVAKKGKGKGRGRGRGRGR